MIKTPVTYDSDGRWYEENGQRIEDHDVSRILNAHAGLVAALKDCRREIKCGGDGSTNCLLEIIDEALAAAGEK